MGCCKVPGIILCLSLPAALGLAAQSPPAVQAQKEAGSEAAALAELRSQLSALRTEYEKRIKDLETRLEELQIQMLRSEPEAQGAVAAAPQAAPAAFTPAALNPAIGVVGNFLGRADDLKVFNEENSRIDNRFNLREVEIDLRAAIDPYADAVVITALGSESPGHYEASIEEGYVNVRRLPFLERPPLGLKLKFGRFRPAFGKFNILHTHDLPQSTRPLPIEEFLGEEGFVQNGASAAFFLPVPFDRGSSLDATLEILGGGEIGASPDPEGRNSYLGHLRWFRTFHDTHNLELGWSTYYRPVHHQAGIQLHGLDLTYRWKPLRQGQWKSFLLGGELMFARHAAPAIAEADSERRTPMGFTLFGQWQFDRRKYAGLRYDSTDVLSDRFLERRSVTPYFSYYFSEYLRFRLSLEHRWSNLTSEAKRNSVFGELTFVFGAHPPEPYWVNR